MASLYEKLHRIKETEKQMEQFKKEEIVRSIKIVVDQDYKTDSNTIITELEVILAKSLEKKYDNNKTYFYKTRQLEQDPFATIYVNLMIEKLKADERFAGFCIKPYRKGDDMVITITW
jgi:Rps23 Pro-64 3,4-dihydroxylase Tpa1-like proline 4-hydroxylase